MDIFEASAMIMMSGGSSSVEYFDYLVGLPTVFSFDMADGWRCELCEDSNPTVLGQGITPYGSDSISYAKTTKKYHIRILCGSELKFITEAVSYPFAAYNEYFQCDGNDIGESIKSIDVVTSNFSFKSIGTYSNTALQLLSIRLGFTRTLTTIDSSGMHIETSNGELDFINYYTKLISKGDLDFNAFVDLVKAMRKFSDDINSVSTS